MLINLFDFNYTIQEKLQTNPKVLEVGHIISIEQHKLVTVKF